MKHKSLFSAYLELTKPRITMLVLVTTFIGYYLGGAGTFSWSILIYLLVGTAIICSGSAVLNHYLERELDSKMNRTKRRPIPMGIIQAPHALSFGIILTLIGLTILYITCNILTAFLSLLTSFLYILVYTPMKRVSWLNTTVGAVPGAIPPLGGWAAATGGLSFEAGMLFLILFIWQHPHFYAIAWMYKDDYARAGFKMLPCIDPTGERTVRQIKIYSIALIPISLIPTVIGMSGYIYFLGVFFSGIALYLTSEHFIKTKSITDAKNLLKATVFYLPILLFLSILDKTF